MTLKLAVKQALELTLLTQEIMDLRMANVCGVSICGDVFKIKEAKYQLILDNFSSIPIPYISILDSAT